MELTQNNQPPSHRLHHTGRWATAIMGLLIVFVLQYGYFMREELARHTVLRPLLERLCILASCEIPMRKDISKIIIVNRDIRSAMDSKHILGVNITLKNIASHVQPYPQMQLNFSDLSGKIIAGRRFDPDEYLSAEMDINEGMMPQIPVIAHLEILDPGAQATTFEFEFF